MKKAKLIYLKNQMLVANGIANFIGVLIANALMLATQEPWPKGFLEYPIVHWTEAILHPFTVSDQYQCLDIYRNRDLFDYLGEPQPKHPVPGHSSGASQDQKGSL